MAKILEIANIIPTHNSLRDPNKVYEYLSMLENGKKLEPVIVKQLDDGKLYLHDGMHRLCAYWLNGITSLNEDQYILKYFTYDQFLEVNFKVGWVTPFDLRTEVRVSDLHEWKDKITLIKENSG